MMSLWNPENWVKTHQPRSEEPVLPRYQIVDIFPTHEVRAYPKTYWCTTLLHGLEEAKKIGLRRLIDYTSGFNDRGEVFHHTAPTAWTMGAGGQVISVSFYMGQGPRALPNTNCCHWPPPRPCHTAVRLECWPAMKIFAKEFNGRADVEDWAHETIMLTKRLSSTDLYSQCQLHCQYNDERTPPFRRRNEVWLLSYS